MQASEILARTKGAAARTVRRCLRGSIFTAWLLPAIPWLITPAVGAGQHDPRDIRMGLVIPDEGYCDQPYVVITPDGNWLCTLTTGLGREGQGGQHVVSTISADCGRSWSPLVDIEPSDGPEAS